VITPQNAYLINSVLESVITRGTARLARALHRDDIAGKTGTTNDQVDDWFVGYNPQIVTAVWMGFDNLQSLHEFGASTALPIWVNFMKQALADKPDTGMPQPEGIVMVCIDPSTGLLANPSQTDVVFEIFREQYVPKETVMMGSVQYQNDRDGSALSKENDSNTILVKHDDEYHGQLFY
jgi:penicillin-binding protein 1A